MRKTLSGVLMVETKKENNTPKKIYLVTDDGHKVLIVKNHTWKKLLDLDLERVMVVGHEYFRIHHNDFVRELVFSVDTFRPISESSIENLDWEWENENEGIEFELDPEYKPKHSSVSWSDSNSLFSNPPRPTRLRRSH